MVSTVVVSVTVRKDGKVQNATSQKVIVASLTVLSTANAFKVSAIAKQVGRVKLVMRKIAKTQLALTMVLVCKASVTVKLAGRENAAT